MKKPPKTFMMKKINILLALLVLTSCSSRKVTTEKAKEKEAVKIEATTQETQTENTNIIREVVINTDVRTGEITKIEKIKPIDLKLPSTYNGRNFQNAEIETTESNKISSDNTKVVGSEKVAKKAKKEVKKDLSIDTEKLKIEKSKKTEVINYIWIFLLVCLLIFLWFIYKRFKNTI